jgi:predicted DNA-binding transcriptional regulator AlpA
MKSLGAKKGTELVRGALLNERDAAALLGVSVRSLQAWRQRGEGPVYVKLGRLVRYRPADLDAFPEPRQATR